MSNWFLYNSQGWFNVFEKISEPNSKYESESLSD
jgi:hypothetical protein